MFDVYCSYKESKDIWDSLSLKYYVEDVVRQRFVIQINEYHKLLEDIKAESIALPIEFMSELLIEKLPQFWTDYKQQLKHKHKQMSLSDLITQIIIEDTNMNKCVVAKAKTLSTKGNVVEDKLTPKR